MKRVAVIATIGVFACGLFGFVSAVRLHEGSSPYTGAVASLPALSQYGSFLIVGDMMFDRTIRARADSQGGDSLFSCMSEYMDSFDVVVGNLEGTITERPSLSLSTVPGQPGNTTFTFPTSTADLLSRHGVRLVSLANNHSLDFGRSGLESTRAILSAAGVGFFGDPLDPSRKSSVRGIGGVPVAFVGFNQFLGVDSVEATVDEIRRVASEAGHVVVFAHWGDEYVPANDLQKATAHAFVDAGADLIVGAHPHVVQESETYKGASIYYSLGNFIFDQYWDDSVRVGLVLEANVTPNGIAATPREVIRSRTDGPCLVYNAE